MLLKEQQSILYPIDLFYIEAVKDHVLQYYSSIIGNSGRILDIGCGWGEKTEFFRRLGMDAYGIDIDPGRIAFAIHHYPDCRFSINHMEYLSFHDEFFDAVFSSSTLQYVNLRKTIYEITRVLKTGGKAVLIENLSYNPFAFCFRTAQRLLHRTYPHHLNPKNHFNLTSIPYLGEIFPNLSYRLFNLTTPLALLIPMVHQMVNKLERIELRPDFSYKILSYLDSILLSLLPNLERYCWTSLVMVTK